MAAAGYPSTREAHGIAVWHSSQVVRWWVGHTEIMDERGEIGLSRRRGRLVALLPALLVLTLAAGGSSGAREGEAAGPAALPQGERGTDVELNVRSGRR